MTESDMDKLAEDLRGYLDRQGQRPKKRKGRYSKAIVAACILLAVGYTAACLWMQWAKGISPEPQLTIAFYSFISVELWSLSKIKRDKNKNGGDK